MNILYIYGGNTNKAPKIMNNDHIYYYQLGAGNIIGEKTTCINNSNEFYNLILV